MTLEVKSLIKEIYEVAHQKAVTARVGKPGEISPELTEDEWKNLIRTQEYLSLNSDRTLWQHHFRSDDTKSLVAKKVRKIGGDTDHQTKLPEK